MGRSCLYLLFGRERPRTLACSVNVVSGSHCRKVAERRAVSYLVALNRLNTGPLSATTQPGTTVEAVSSGFTSVYKEMRNEIN
jgi:hypothetical protein